MMQVFDKYTRRRFDKVRSRFRLSSVRINSCVDYTVKTKCDNNQNNNNKKLTNICKGLGAFERIIFKRHVWLVMQQ